MTGERPQIGLYAIAGSYKNQALHLEGDGDEMSVAFGGYFKAKSSESGNEGDFDIKGQVIDMFGPADIEGQISGEQVDFTKRYESRDRSSVRSEVVYSLHQEGESHIGTYSIHPDLYVGRVIASISKIDEDAYDMVMGPIRGR